MQGQILEDLSLDADALCMLRLSPPAEVAAISRASPDDPAECGPSALPRDADATTVTSEFETIAVSQLRGLECHAKQVSC